VNALRGAGKTALILGFLTFAFLAALFQVYDHDVGYHLKTGEWIDQQGRLPERDPFSFTRAGVPWPLQQGASAWILWQVYSAGGVTGLITFKAVLVALIYGVVLWIAWRESGSVTLATAVSFLGVLAGRYRFYERPMLFSALLLALLVACLSDYRRRPRPAPLVLAVGLLTVWANLHAGWLDGMIALGAFAFAGTLAGMFGRFGVASRAIAAEIRGARAAWAAWGAALVLSIFSLSFLNPMGPKVLLIPFSMMRSEWFQAHVAEFLPLPLANYEAVWALLVLTALALVLAWARHLLRPTDALLFGVFAWGTLTVNRQMLPLSVIAPPILAYCAGSLFPQFARTSIRERLRALGAVAVAVAMAAVAWFGFIQGDRFRFGFGVDERSTPLGAFHFIEANALPGEVWNEDAWGGAFLWHFWPERRDFVDNRLGVFNEAFFRKSYIPVRDAHPGWQGLLDRYAVNTLLMEFSEKPIGIHRAAFRSPLWALVYWDDWSLVYVRRSAAPEALLRQFEYRFVNPVDLKASLGRRASLPAAIGEMERAVRTNGDSWRALNGLGVAYGMAGRYAEASAMFRRTLEAHPDSDAALANLRIAQRRLDGALGPRGRPGSGEGS
jgi:hypothetical protein